MKVDSDDLYTMRWHLSQDPPQDQEALGIVNTILGAPPHSGTPGDPDTAHEGAKLLRCPWAVTTGLPEAKTEGRYRKGYPEGAVVHFTAGHHAQDPIDAVKYQVSRGHCYFLIAPDGKVYQNFPLNHWGSHAGRSAWSSIGPGWVSKYLVGIEVMSPGKLAEDRSPWYGNKPFPADECREVLGDQQRLAGVYHKFTKAQEDALFRLVRWLRSNNPDVFSFKNVLGHDEVSGPRGLGYHRKNDPGGSLSMTMDMFRHKLPA